MQWYTSERLGPTRSLTPEGYLLCEGVPIARTGPMLYAAGEVPVTPGADGVIRIMRLAEDVFTPQTIASYNGKPVVITHPDELVTPRTCKELSVGTIFNTRQGAGLKDDYLFADLLITDANAIAELEGENPEVSCGYDAQYQELAPGRGRQFNIIGNHVAIVPKGRCGPTCSIGDSEMTTSVLDRVRTAFRTNDARAFDAAMGELMGAPNPGATVPGSATTQDPNAGGGSTPHRIVVNVHGGGSAGPTGVADAPPPSIGQPGVVTNPPPAVSPSQGGAGSVDQRLASIESAIQQLLQMVTDGDGEDEPSGGESGTPAPSGGAPSNPPKAGGEENTDDKKMFSDDDMVASGTDPIMKDMKLDPKAYGALTKASNQGKTETMLGDTSHTTGAASGTGDSAALVNAYRDTVSRAEILSPGLKPKATFDAKAKSNATMDCICDLQRRALAGAMTQDATKKIIEPIVGNSDIAKMTADALHATFMGASELMRRVSNNHMVRNSIVNADTTSKGVPSIQEINKRNEEFWRKRGAA